MKKRIKQLRKIKEIIIKKIVPRENIPKKNIIRETYQK